MCDNKEKTLTVVIPTYNMERYLGQCLDSVTAEDVTDDLEVIIVNDGSTDSSLEIAEEYRNKRPDIIRIISKENGNYGSCVNAGLKEAKGKYFRILDADDRFDTSALVKLLSNLQSCNTDLVVTLAADEIYSGEDKVATRYYKFPTVTFNQIYNLEEFNLYDYCDYRNNELRMHTMTYKTSVLHNSGMILPSGISYTDTLYVFAPFSYIKDFVLYDLNLYMYRVGREGQTMDYKKNSLKNLFDITKVLLEMIIIMNHTPNDNHLKVNQAYLFICPLNFFLRILKGHSGLPKELYGAARDFMELIKHHKIPLAMLNKWYYRLWKLTGSSKVLDWALHIRHLYDLSI